MIQFLRSVIEEGTQASSKRFVLVAATLTLCPATIGLTVAAILGHQVAEALWAVTTPLAGMAGVAYVGGKAAERGQLQGPSDAP